MNTEGRTLAVCAAATLLVLCVFTSPLPTVVETAKDFDAGLAWQTWVLSGMSLGLASALLGVGALADRIGRRRVLVASTAALAATSLLAAVSPGIAVFVVARVLQGVAGAGVIAASLAAIGHAFPAGPARTRATGIWGASVGGGIAVGPLLSALLADAGSWRLVSWAEALAALALLLAARGIGESRAEHARAVDVPGTVTLAAAMGLVTAGIVEGRSSWTSALTLFLLLAGIALLLAFGAVERRRREPMVDLALLREPLFVAAIAGALFTGLALIALMSFLPSYLQRGLQLTPLGSAAVLAFWSATSTVVALGARRLPARFDSRTRLLGAFALAAVGNLALVGMSAGSHWWRLAPGLVLAGVGSGIGNAALGRLAVESVAAADAGMGSGASNTARYLGGAAGVAVVVAVFSAGSHDGSAAGDLAAGWNLAAIVAAGLCVAAVALIVLAGACREEILVRPFRLDRLPAAVGQLDRRRFLGVSGTAMLCALGGSGGLGSRADVLAADRVARAARKPTGEHLDPVDALKFGTPTPQPGGQVREYWVQAKSLMWDVAPTGRDDWMGMAIPRKRRFRAFAYQQYTAGFATPIGRATIPGPTLQAQVGDVIVAHVRNGDEHFDQAITMHPHGVRYTPDYDGAYYGDYTRVGGFIAPGEEFTYTWEATPDSVGVWPYHDHGPNHLINTSRGLFGAIIIRPPGAPVPNVETVLFLHSFAPNVTGLDQQFQVVNGRTAAGNTPTVRAKLGQDVAWHVFGGDSMFHTFHVHGHRWKDPSGAYVDNPNLGPLNSVTARWTEDNPGRWLYHCHVASHQMGMAGWYFVEE